MLIISNRKWDALQTQVKAMQQTSLAAQFNNFSTQIFPTWRIVQEMDAYHTMAFLYSVVSKLATNSAMIPFYAYDKEKDTDLPDSDKLALFLQTLDFEQKEKLYTFLYLCGEVFMHKDVIELGPNAGNMRVNFLHPSRMTLVLSQTFPTEIVGYKYTDTVNGVAFDINYEDIIFIKFFNPSVDLMEEWRGLSPVKVLARTLTMLESGEDVITAQLQNGGVKDIVYDESPGLSTEVISKRRENFGRFLRNKSNTGAPYFSANKLGHIGLGSTLTDMEVIALGKANHDMICNVYHISSILFNDKSSSTESNVQEMVKEMYTNTIVPNCHRVESALNKGAVPFLQTKGVVKCDTSEIKALRDDETKKAAALAQKWWLTGNERREADEYDQDINDPLMDKYIIPSGFVLLDDLNMVTPDVSNAAGDYQPPKVVPLKTANG